MIKTKTCLCRIKMRDQSIQINISDEQISKINAKVIERNLLTYFHFINANKNEKELNDEILIILNILNRTISLIKK